jgi:hypothetical protein
VLAVEDIRRHGCVAAGVRLAGEDLAVVCRLDLYGAWRLLTVFEAPDRCVLLVVAEHTRTANPYRLLYAASDIAEPEDPARSRHAVTPAASRLSTPALSCDSSAAYEIWPAVCLPRTGHAANGVTRTGRCVARRRIRGRNHARVRLRRPRD